jgi:hypothetical protein
VESSLHGEESHGKPDHPPIIGQPIGPGSAAGLSAVEGDLIRERPDPG